MINLRHYQKRVIELLLAAWTVFKVVMVVIATGGGKTVTFAYVIMTHRGPACAIAHRQELVGQISCTLASFGVRHRLIASDEVIKNVISLHLELYGRSFVDPSAMVGVAGVNMIAGSSKKVDVNWLKSVTLLIHDEAHHVLKDNIWGRATKKFTNSKLKILEVTATPERADGKGLGSHSDGIAEHMIEGPTVKQLQDEGFLTPHKVVMAESDIEFTEEMFSKVTGELNEKGKAAVRGSHIVGDVVSLYLEHTPGKPAAVFCDSVETSLAVAEEFRRRGVAALHVDGDTDDTVRLDAVRKLKSGKIQVLTNVDLFGEGFDLPLLMAAYDCSATESYAKFAQRFGRILRLLISKSDQENWDSYSIEKRHAIIAASDKPFGLYVDLVGNIVRHQGTPDMPRMFSLDAREKKSGGGAASPEALTMCLNDNKFGQGIACMFKYARYKTKCPECGYGGAPRNPTLPEHVDGNLFLLDAETVRALFSKAINLQSSAPITGAGAAADRACMNKHYATLRAQRNLRDAMSWWAGERRTENLNDAEVYKYFYLQFGIDWATAFSLREKDADVLAFNIDLYLTPRSLSARLQETA